MRLVKRGITLSVLALLAVLVASLAAHAQDKTLTIWTMGGDQPGWVKWLDAIAGNFEKNNSGAKGNGGRSCKYAIPPVPGEILQLVLHRHLLPVGRDAAHLRKSFP